MRLSVRGERRLVDEIRVNLAYRWFIGSDRDEAIPDHSVLSKARRWFGPTIYEAFFTEVVRQCERAGPIRGNRLFLDSTLVAAHADPSRVGSRELIRQVATVGELVADLREENPEAMVVAGGDPTAPDGAPGSAHAADGGSSGVAEATAGPVDEPGERVALHVGGPDHPPNTGLGLLNDRLVSRTDPDATIVQREGPGRPPTEIPADLYYKVHVVDGGQARVITAVDATTGIVGDEQLLPRLVAEHEGNTRRRTLEVAAGTKYGTIDNYLWLEERDVRAAIPFSDGGIAHGLIPRSAFCYDPKTDTYRCPTGDRLTRQGRTTTTAAHPLIIYRPRPADCAACPLKQNCRGTARVRSVSRPDDGGLPDRTVAYLGTGPARRLTRQRKAWAETVFGDGKERRGLRPDPGAADRHGSEYPEARAPPAGGTDPLARACSDRRRSSPAAPPPALQRLIRPGRPTLRRPHSLCHGHGRSRIRRRQQSRKLLYHGLVFQSAPLVGNSTFLNASIREVPSDNVGTSQPPSSSSFQA